MTPKQKLKSIEKKMERIQDGKPEFDYKKSTRNFYDIQRYFNLEKERFLLEFEINHCEKCGKKLIND